MPYVKRDIVGKIIALTSTREQDHDEYLPTTAKEVIEFLSEDSTQSDALQALRESDGELARVLEDLIKVLIQKQVILFTDLPDAVQEKLVARQKLRSMLNQDDSTILIEDNDMF